MDLGQRLREARMASGTTQEELAKQLGVSRQTISNWENGRTVPDVGSVVTMGQLYQISLDKLLNGEEVFRHFEDLAKKRRKFWQMMLEIGVSLELLGNLLSGLELTEAGTVVSWAGFLLLNVSIVMHLRVFHHNRGEILRGLLGLAGHWILILWVLLFPDAAAWTGLDAAVYDLVIISIKLALLILIWSASVWTFDWKSTRLWLIIALYLGTPLLLMGVNLQDSGKLMENNPFLRDYRVEEVLYPQGDHTYEHALVELGSDSMMLALDGVDREYIGIFDYTEPTIENTAKGIWLMAPEKDPSGLYKLVLEQDDSVLLSHSQNGELIWKWKLKPDHRKASLWIDTLGHSSSRNLSWYPGGPQPFADPEPYFKSIDVVEKADATISVIGLNGQPLTLQEEYHHEDQVDYETYQLFPEKEGRYNLELKARYGGLKRQYAVYRIPYEDGEFRFTLTFEGF